MTQSSNSQLGYFGTNYYNIFLSINGKYICQNCSIYLSKFQNVCVQRENLKEMRQQGCTRQTGPWHSLMKPPGPEWSHQQVMYIPLHWWVHQAYRCSFSMFYIVLHWFTLFHIVLHWFIVAVHYFTPSISAMVYNVFIVLHCFTSFYIILHCFMSFYILLHCFEWFCSFI